MYKDEFFNVEAINTLKPCLTDEEMAVRRNFQKIVIPDKILNKRYKQVNEVYDSQKVEINQTQFTPDVIQLINKLTMIDHSCISEDCKFQARTQIAQHKMDCLVIFQHRSEPENYYSVYHKMDHTINNFITYLARSKNGMDNWELITMLDEEASQVKIWLSPNSDDILVAYEASPGFRGNFIVVK